MHGAGRGWREPCPALGTFILQPPGVQTLEPGSGEAVQHPPSFIPAAVVAERGCQVEAQDTAGWCNLSANLHDSKANWSSCVEPAGSLLNPWKDFT